ncbi:hypothetical protein CS379_33405 [Methylobacterium frigidaeris]|nr:hypothetical protein CS379_33405 [Methylobacterium frigidaeris]
MAESLAMAGSWALRVIRMVPLRMGAVTPGLAAPVERFFTIRAVEIGQRDPSQAEAAVTAPELPER